jgi:hypothetical protein
MTFKHTCLASRVILSCNDANCGYVYNGFAKETLKEKSNERERNTNYAVNILYVLGFITCGDGGLEAARMLGLLCLPNDTTMETRSFPNIEDEIGPFIRKLTKGILLENLAAEVKAAIDSSPEEYDEDDFLKWQSKMNSPNTVALSKAKYPRIFVAFDMGWQQRSSGNRYASLHQGMLFLSEPSQEDQLLL